MSIRCLVIDDEPLAISVLAGFIRKTAGLQLVDVTTDPARGLQRIKAGETDLVFLDIEMPTLNGIQLMEQAGAACSFVLTTAYSEYALQGYEYSVKDYLLKPFSYERFLKALQKIPPKPDTGKAPDYFFIRSEYKLLRIDHADLLYLEALRDYVAVHTGAGKKILTLQSLASFEKELPAPDFLRIHKSYLIALNRVSVFERNKVWLGERCLPVGDTYRQRLLDAIQTR